MRVVEPSSIIELVHEFKKEFKDKMDLIVDAVQGSTSNPWATKVSINIAKKLEQYEVLFFEEPCRVENLNGYKEIGINRISFGFQSLDDKLLKFLDRLHSAKQCILAFE